MEKYKIGKRLKLIRYWWKGWNYFKGLQRLTSSMPLIVKESSGIHHYIIRCVLCYILSSAPHRQAVYWSISELIQQLTSTTPIVTKVEEKLAKKVSNERIWCVVILGPMGISLALHWDREWYFWFFMCHDRHLLSLKLMYPCVQIYHHMHRFMTSEGTDGKNEMTSVSKKTWKPEAEIGRQWQSVSWESL